MTAVLAAGTSAGLPDGTADVIYALDMFHMVREPAVFLRELNRICKATGALYINSGHQSTKEAISKILSSGAWEIVERKKRYLKCAPTRASKERPERQSVDEQSTERLTGTSFR